MPPTIETALNAHRLFGIPLTCKEYATLIFDLQFLRSRPTSRASILLLAEENSPKLNRYNVQMFAELVNVKKMPCHRLRVASHPRAVSAQIRDSRW